MSDFYLDQQGAGVASRRFGDRAADLSGAATGMASASTCGTEEVSVLLDHLAQAAAGRMYAVSDELSELAQLVVDTVTVYNQLDVTYATV